MDIVISNLLLESIFDFGKWSKGIYTNMRIRILSEACIGSKYIYIWFVDSTYPHSIVLFNRNTVKHLQHDRYPSRTLQGWKYTKVQSSPSCY